MWRRIRNLFDLASADAREAKRESRSFAGESGNESLASFTERNEPELDSGLRFAENSEEQTLHVLEHKEKLVKNLNRMAEGFWKKQEKRKKQIENELSELKKKKDKKSVPDSIIRDLTEQEMVLSDELDSLKHIEEDAKRIEEALQKKRKHDIRPLFAKSGHMSKIIAFEEREGAVNPGTLKQYEVYERSLLKKMEDIEDREIEKDEFQAVEKLKKLLRKEISLLEKQGARASSKRKKEIKKRINETLTQELMSENLLKMATLDNLQQKKARDNCKRIYKILNWISGMEQKEKHIAEKSGY